MPQDVIPKLATGDAEIGMLRLRTLVRLRWLAIVGQTGAVLGVHFVLGFPLPLGLCLAVIALQRLAQHLSHHPLAQERQAA